MRVHFMTLNFLRYVVWATLKVLKIFILVYIVFKIINDWFISKKFVYNNISPFSVEEQMEAINGPKTNQILLFNETI